MGGSGRSRGVKGGLLDPYGARFAPIGAPKRPFSEQIKLDMARYGAENDQMCFLCFHVFCVFLTKKIEKNIMDFDFFCVFVFLRGINLIIQFIKSPCYKTRFTTPMCFMCFCVFSIQCRKWPTQVFCVFLCFFGWKLRPGHTTHVFDVFLCFLISRGCGVRHVFCVFLCFSWANLVQTRSQHQCVLCAFVFSNSRGLWS